MIGPVSGTGRAMMASLQQAIEKGMPPDQAVQYVKSMATQGVAPLADLYTMMNQFQRLKQPQVQAPQTPPTIRDQLNIMDQQQRPQGIQQMQAPPPAGQPMDRGLGAIDAGRMQYPQFAGGGIVAFQDRGLVEDIDFAKMSVEQLRTLTSDENREIAKAAYQEFLRRTGYVAPQEYLSRYIDLVKQGFPKGGAFTYDPRPLPSYMYDEQGNVRKGEITAGIGGLKEVPSSRTMVRQLSPETPERFAQAQASFANRLANPPTAASSQSAVPPAGSTPYSGSFDQMLAGARADSFGRPVAQDRIPTPPARRETGAGAGAGAANTFARLIKEERERKFTEVPDTFSGEEKKRIEKALSGLSSEKQDAVRMALAQAGFGMAAAASRSGRQRTSALGALAEGALGGMQQYNAAQKELRQTERELNKEMGALRRYQDEVARGERTRELAFEESKRDNIAQLTAQQTSANLQLAQLQSSAEDRRLAREERTAERLGTEKYRTQSVQLEALKARLDGINDAIKTLAYPSTEEDKARLQTLMAERMRLSAQLEALGGGSAVPTTGFGGAGSFPGFSATPMK